MFQITKVSEELRPVLAGMLDELGEPAQVLTADSPHPLVVHRSMGQLTFVAGGNGYVSLAGQTHRLEPGDLIVMAPGCEHAFLCPAGLLHLRHWHWPQRLLDTDRAVLAEAFTFATGNAVVGGGLR
jgi:quercetin dioxygenase-like cupin family protein